MDFVAGFFSSFLWETAPRKRKSSGKFPAKASKLNTTKIPDTFCRGTRPTRVVLVGLSTLLGVKLRLVAGAVHYLIV